MPNQYTIEFRAPALPYAPTEYNALPFNTLNNILRLYFNQLDNALRDTSLADRSDAVGWFIG
jgi:hypothetical protein